MTIPASPAWWQRVCRTNAPAATVLIRCYAGLVFASEGVLKFLRPRSLGVGRFTQAGIAGGGADGREHGRGAAAHELPILWSASPLFKSEQGVGNFLHEARLDIAQLCGTIQPESSSWTLIVAVS